MPKATIAGNPGLLNAPKKTNMGAKGFAQRCENVLIRTDGVYEPRFGTEVIYTGSITNRVFYDQANAQVLQYIESDANNSNNPSLYKYDGASFTSIDSGNKWGAVERLGTYLYGLTNTGLRRITAANTGTESATLPLALDPTVTVGSGGTGVMASNSQYAYRVVWGYRDSTGDWSLGAPSGRAIGVNSSTLSQTPTLTIPVPTDVTSSHFLQIYRTLKSASSSSDPGDDMLLVYEAFPTSGELSARLMTVVDYAVEGTGGAALYTNETSLIDSRPSAKCDVKYDSTHSHGTLAAFDGRLFSHPYKPLSSLFLYLMSVGTTPGLYAATVSCTTTNASTTVTTASTAPFRVGMHIYGTGIAAGTTISSITNATTFVISANASASATNTMNVGDTITIATNTYYAVPAATGEDIPNHRFAVYSAGTVNQNIRNTAYSLIRNVNQDSRTTYVTMSYESPVDAPAGKMLIRAKTDTASTYSVVSTQATAWSPNLATSVTIPSIGKLNTIMFSKTNNGLAWPELNTISTPDNSVVLGLVALRSALMVITDRGIGRISGSNGLYGFDMIDTSFQPLYTSTQYFSGAVVSNNVAYTLTTQGLLAINESSVALIPSTPQQLVNYTPSAGSYLSVHTADNNIFIPHTSGTFVYNTQRSTWTTFTHIYKTGAFSRADSKFYYARGDSYLKRQRDAQYLAANYYDNSTTAVVSSYDTSAGTVTTTTNWDSYSDYQPGDVVTRGSYTGVISAKNGTVLTLEDMTGFPNSGTFTVYGGFDSTITYCPIATQLSDQQRYRDGVVLFDGADKSPTSLTAYNNSGLPTYVTVGFSTEQQDTELAQSGFEATPNNPHSYRFMVPFAAQRATYMTLSVSWRTCKNKIRLVGAEFNVLSGSEKSERT